MVKVLYIGGSGRSGSTILDSILGQFEGFMSVGEVRFIWKRGLIDDRLCSCGEAFSDCPFWTEVLDRAFGGAAGIDPGRILELMSRGTRARRIPMMLGGAGRRQAFVRGLDELPEVLSRLYAAIRDTSGARVIVDSSKLPTYGYVLGTAPGIDLRVVHLVRDPRAAAYSWQRKKPLPDKRGAYMQRQGTLRSSALWMLWNTTPSLFWPDRMRIRYEDFVREPSAIVERIVEYAGEESEKGPFVAPTEVELEPSHSVAGNPSRFTTGRVAVQPDEEWRRRMRPVDRRLVTGLTWPLLGRYGYRDAAR
jgi:hypothetical protein